MYRRILLAYDGSLEGRVALREGVLLAAGLRAKIYLLAVTPPIAAPDATGAVSVQPEIYDAIFREGLEKAKQLGVTIVGEMSHGDPAEAISAYARKIAADLVVVGHRRRTLLERWWSGPSQSFLTDRIGCSVLVARNVISDEMFDKTLRAYSTPAEHAGTTD